MPLPPCRVRRKSWFGGLDAGSRIEIEHSPGMFPWLAPDPFSANWRNRWGGPPAIPTLSLEQLRCCQSDVERPATRTSYIAITLVSGVECRITAEAFSATSFATGQEEWSQLPEECQSAVISQALRGRSGEVKGVRYVVTKPVRSIVVDFSIRIFCGCWLGGATWDPTPKELRARILKPYTFRLATEGTLSLVTRFP
jgi:hypothetical protein